MRYLVIYPEDDAEDLNCGPDRAVAYLNNHIIEATSIVNAVLLRHFRKTDFEEILKEYKASAALHYFRTTLVLPLDGVSKFESLSESMFKDFVERFKQQDDKEELARDLAEIKRLKNKHGIP